jgi:2,3-bisphosphoglycerate-independent phosphoglycerate mutase
MGSKKAFLIIMDGWGHGNKRKGDAIAQADIPFVNSLYQKYPNSELVTFGMEVGLPEGQMGNSEVGHLNIGAGRIVYQELARINKAIQDNTFQKEKVLVDAMQYAKDKGKKMHLIGLVSDGGVHSHIQHLLALCDMSQSFGLEKVYIHAFTDGRDTDPKGGYNYLQTLQNHIKNTSAQIATVTGRYFAMDRDKRWERVRLAYDAMVNADGDKSHDLLTTIKNNYENGISDEFLKPIINVDTNNKPLATIEDGDVVISFNFRTDRPREITEVLSQKAIEGMTPLKDLYFVTMTRYDDTYKNIHVVYHKDDLVNTIGEVISKHKMTQVRIAETEKYPHVTFFFSGGREEPFDLEKRLLIPSPKVATYDFQPEMSAIEITASILAEMQAHQPNFICLNYANTDMVGHTGIISAAMTAASTVSDCVSQLVALGLELDYEMIIIADHGNSDYMLNDDGTPNTAHSMNPVPCFYVSKNAKGRTIKNGKLADIAPTILHLLNITPPLEMDGENLIL